MTNYTVVKYYGHFCQHWRIKAETEEEAWRDAETKGSLELQAAYANPTPTAKDYIVNLDERKSKAVTKKQYREWLLEAEQLGMTITPLYKELYLGGT